MDQFQLRTQEKRLILIKQPPQNKQLNPPNALTCRRIPTMRVCFCNKGIPNRLKIDQTFHQFAFLCTKQKKKCSGVSTRQACMCVCKCVEESRCEMMCYYDESWSRRRSAVPTCFLRTTILARASCRLCSLWSNVQSCCSGRRCSEQKM